MASSRSSASFQSRPTQPTKSTNATTIASGSKRSSAKDGNFGQHLIDHNIYPPLYDFPDDRLTPEPDNLDDLRAGLDAPRASLSPSVFTGSVFRDFQRKNETRSEGTVMRNVIPILAGSAGIPNEGHLPFTNLDWPAGGATVKAVPDFFDGARPGDIHDKVKDDLKKQAYPQIIPKIRWCPTSS